MKLVTKNKSYSTLELVGVFAQRMMAGEPMCPKLEVKECIQCGKSV